MRYWCIVRLKAPLTYYSVIIVIIRGKCIDASSYKVSVIQVVTSFKSID